MLVWGLFPLHSFASPISWMRGNNNWSIQFSNNNPINQSIIHTSHWPIFTFVAGFIVCIISFLEQLANTFKVTITLKEGVNNHQNTKGRVQNKKCPKLWKKSKRGGVSAKIKKVYISNVDSLWLRVGGGLNFSYFSKIKITEIWPWFLWYMGLILVRYMQHLVHIWPIYE